MSEQILYVKLNSKYIENLSKCNFSDYIFVESRNKFLCLMLLLKLYDSISYFILVKVDEILIDIFKIKFEKL